MNGLADKFKVFIDLIEEFCTSIFSWNAVIVILAGIATLVVQVRLEYKRTSTNKKKEKAIELGHVVNAQRIKYRDDKGPADVGDACYSATYGYTVNGKKYEYRYFGLKYPEEEIQVYYINNPRKVFCDYNEKHYPCILCFIPFIVMAIVYNFLE